MIKLLIYLNLLNLLDAFITSYAIYVQGGFIEMNPFFTDNVLLGMWLVKIPVVLLISFVTYHYDKRIPAEKIFLTKIVIIMCGLLGLVVLWNCWMLLLWS